jgi:microcystin-dependent protein
MIARVDYGLFMNVADTGCLFPIGTIAQFPRNFKKKGWVQYFDGHEVTKDDFPELYAVLGKAYNDGTEPQGVFRLPDLRERVTGGLR